MNWIVLSISSSSSEVWDILEFSAIHASFHILAYGIDSMNRKELCIPWKREGKRKGRDRYQNLVTELDAYSWKMVLSMNDAAAVVVVAAAAGVAFLHSRRAWKKKMLSSWGGWMRMAAVAAEERSIGNIEVCCCCSVRKDWGGCDPYTCARGELTDSKSPLLVMKCNGHDGGRHDRSIVLSVVDRSSR